MIKVKISTGESHCVCEPGFPTDSQYVINHVGSPAIRELSLPSSYFPLSPVFEHCICYKKVFVSPKFNESLPSAVYLPDPKFVYDIFVSAVVVSQDGIEVSTDYNEIFLWNGVEKTLRVKNLQTPHPILTNQEHKPSLEKGC